MEPINTETHIVFATVVNAGKLYSEQTINFTVTSRKGVKYVFILYLYDNNKILSETLKMRTKKDILHTYTTRHDYLKKQIRPKNHWLDNEVYNAQQKYNRNQKVDVQIVPPGVH